VDASTSPKAIDLQGTNSVAAIQVSATTPAAFSSIGEKTIAGYLDESDAPFGFNADGTYSSAAFTSAGFTVFPDGSVNLASLVFGLVPPDCADDAAAAAVGILIGGVYRTGNDLKIRIA
jgi:hypothetical protein